MTHAKADVSIRGLERHIGDVRALDGVTLDIPAGETLAVLGAARAAANPHCCASWRVWTHQRQARFTWPASRSTAGALRCRRSDAPSTWCSRISPFGPT